MTVMNADADNTESETLAPDEPPEVRIYRDQRHPSGIVLPIVR